MDVIVTLNKSFVVLLPTDTTSDPVVSQFLFMPFSVSWHTLPEKGDLMSPAT